MAIVTARQASGENRRPRLLARALGLVAAFIGILVLAGWTLKVAMLTSVLPGLVTMKPNTATAMLLSGVGLALLSRRRVEKPVRYMAAAAALVTLALAALTLGQYVVGWDFGIDQWLFNDTARTGTSHPGRMSPASSLCFVFVAAALLTAAQTRFARLRDPIVAGLGASVMATGTLALLGYVLESRFDYHLWNYTGTAIHSAVGFVLLGCGLLALVRSQGRLRWSLEPANTAALAVAIALMVFAAGISYDFASKFRETAGWVVHTEKVLARLQEVATDIATLESNQRGYVLTGDEGLLPLVARAKAQVPRDSAVVRTLTADNPDQQRRLDRLEPLLAQRVELADLAIAARRQHGHGLAIAEQMVATGADAALTARIGRLLDEMQEAEDVLLDRRQEQAGAASVTNLLLLPLGLLLSLTTMSLGIFFLNAGVEERSRAEQAASESRARMAAMIDSATDAVISVDHEQSITLFNDAAERMFGRSAVEAIGQPIAAFIPLFHEEHRRHIQGFEKRASTSRSMRALATLRGLRADGDEFPIEASISQVEVRGERIFTAIMRDISERQSRELALRESEEKLRLALDATQLGTWEVDPRTGERLWSDRSKALFGFPVEAHVSSSMIDARIHPEDGPRLDAIVMEALQPDGGGVLDTEFRIPGMEGREERWVQSRGRVLFEDGRAVRVIGTMLDITERKRAEEALRASEGRYRTLFECAPDGIVIADGESYYTSANPSMCRMLGYSPDELIGMHASDIVVQSEVENIALALTTIKAGTGHQREWLFRRKDGSDFAAEVIATMMPDGALMGMVRDITERKHAEAALRESEQRFRTMANCILQLAWIARPDGYIFWYNERWFEYTGTTPEQMEGWGWQGVHDPDVLPAVMKGWTDAIDAGKTFEMEFPLRGANGQFRSFLSRVQPLKDPQGRVVQWFGTNTDVQALKEAEERVHQLNTQLEKRVAERTAQLEAANAELSHSRAELKSLFESLPGLYLVLTPDLHIVAVSDAYLKATLTTREGILGRHLFDVFPDNPDDPDTKAVASMQASMDRVVRDGAPDTMAIQKHDVRRPDGTFEERYWSPINSPVFGADRKIKYVVHRVEEVTDFVRQKAKRSDASPASSARLQQMEAEIFQSSQKLQAANLKLQSANHELEAFSYSISHDLRAPLRSVDGYVRMIQEDHSERLDADGHRLLGVVSSEAKRMGRLIDDLLAFSRLGRERMACTSVDMGVLARGAFESLTSTAPERAPRFELGPLPRAQGDLAMLRQVFVNLIGNAIKFSRNRAAPTVEVGCFEKEIAPPPADAEIAASGVAASGVAATRSETTYYVKDNGAGFDERYSHKLFGVFQRLHSEEEFEGTGVGLALVQRIIQRHGGRVWGESGPGDGATFYFIVPNEEEQSA